MFTRKRPPSAELAPVYGCEGEHLHGHEAVDGHGHAAGHVFEHEPAPRTERKLISRLDQAALLLGNAALGAAEIALGGVSKAASVMADGLHNIGDFVSYIWQTDAVLHKEKLPPEKIYKRRKRAYWALSFSAGLVAAKSGYDLADSAITGMEPEHHPALVYVAAPSLAFNSIMLARMRRNQRRQAEELNVPLKHYRAQPAEKDLMDHMVKQDIPFAATALVGALAQKHGFIAFEQLAGLSIGAFGAYYFRPTKKNLKEGCHGHGHGAVGHGHGHAHGESGPKVTLSQKLFSHVWAAQAYTSERLQAWGRKREMNTFVNTPEKWRRRSRVKLGVAAVAGVVGSTLAWHMSKGLFSGSEVAAVMPEIPRGSGVSAPPAELPVGPKTSTELPIDPPSFEQPKTPEPPVYSAAAHTVQPGEGLFSVFNELGIEQKYHSELLAASGQELSEMRFEGGAPVAYFEDFNGQRPGEWRLNMPADGRMATEVLDYLSGATMPAR